MTHKKQKPAIETIKLTRYFDTTCAVDQISFSVQQGEIFGLLGPNGAGKSTTIKMLTTLLPPTSGKAFVAGYAIDTEPAEVRKEIGYVPQLLSTDGDLTALENLTLSAKLYGLASAERKKRMAEVLDFMGLTSHAGQLVSTFSGGMIRRLEIAQALIHQPRVLFLDEPTVGLDPSARKSLWQHILELRKTFNTAILMTTHDMDEADNLCDRVAFMHLGEIVANNTPDKLKSCLGNNSSLGDVFIHYTGTSIKEGGDFNHAKQIRRTVANLD